jgi:hypothetical protein
VSAQPVIFEADLKNEATDFVENKGPGLGKVRNEATNSVVSRQSSVFRAGKAFPV